MIATATHYQSLPDARIRELIARTRDPALTEAERLEARNTVLLSNTGWRLKLAEAACRNRPTMNTGMEIEDLANHALILEIRAIELFDLTSENNYTTYATFWIRRGISEALRRYGSLIRRPNHIFEIESKLRKGEISSQSRKNGVRYAIQSRYQVYSLDAPLTKDGDPIYTNEPVSRDSTFDAVEEREDQAARLHIARLAMDRLDPRSQLVVRMRSEGRKLWEVGEAIGVTRERARQIERKAYLTIRIYLAKKGVTTP